MWSLRNGLRYRPSHELPKIAVPQGLPFGEEVWTDCLADPLSLMQPQGYPTTSPSFRPVNSVNGPGSESGAPYAVGVAQLPRRSVDGIASAELNTKVSAPSKSAQALPRVSYMSHHRLLGD
jgi:hypothetical protein